MELYFLGTGAGIPSKQRNVSAAALRFFNDQGSTWLFDCGEATQHQILYTPLKLSKIDKIFITHLHGDHIYGLPGVLGSRSFQGTETPLTLFGPKGLKDFVQTSLSVSGTFLRYRLEVVEVEDGAVFKERNTVIKVKKLVHGIPSFGYRIEEENQAGSLQVDKLKALGVPPGPLYGQLKEGKQIQLEDGRFINGKDFLGPCKKGRKIAVLGDTRYTEAAIELAKDVDVLVHEATFGAHEQELAHQYYHSTSVQAAKVAKMAEASSLILTHISSRYGENADRLLNEAKEQFVNTYLAKDLWSYSIQP
ncbi:ribonuclease Z [Bacillus taeanensis]|uniref:Ribonuclease Z n=1 Tax=Bacillus taeanensis TaxID=273032 RepID=A0A366XYD6_9BACI|nr:ribonuclease Z [Bacillus taeanensis]RBW70636.1 ribonuclease Z [Bacillus taeanensis]